MLVLARWNQPCDSTLALLSGCRTLKDANQIHARFITTGLLRNPSLTAQIVLHLSSSPHPPLQLLARRLFFTNPNPSDPFLWNALIKSFSHGRDPVRAILTFSHMLSNGVSADKFSFSLALKACSRLSSLKEGSQIHSLIHKTELLSVLYLQNSLIGFYTKCGRVDCARVVFDRMPKRDSVSWNSMIDGYVKIGKLDLAQELFDQMDNEEKNLVSWNTIISGYAQSVDGINVARVLFDRMPERDSVSFNLMIDSYAKCGKMGDAEDLFERTPVKDVIAWANMIAGYMEVGRLDLARRLFDEMPERDLITWNIMLAGYVKNGSFAEALSLFNEMRVKGVVAPDITTLATTLSAISELGRVNDGISLHEYIERNQLPIDGKLGVALIDMYSKCGQLENALRIFEISGRRSVDHWNAMIGGLAIHGLGELALQLFGEMERLLLKPDDITFIGVLNACSHAGLVKEGMMCFEIMRKDYRVNPKVQHYGCMVDILGRAGKLEEAWKLIEIMPFEPNDVVWRSLLSACKNHGNFDIGQQVAEHLIEGGSCSPSSFVLLSNLYAGVAMWGHVSKVRMMMKEKDIRKIPGCSWIELDGMVHEFVVGDQSHPQSKEIYSMLEKMCSFNLYISEVTYRRH